MKYKILRASSLAALETIVQAYLNNGWDEEAVEYYGEGWEPQGGVTGSSSSPYYMQAMVQKPVELEQRVRMAGGFY